MSKDVEKRFNHHNKGFGRKIWMKKLEQKGYSFKNSPEAE